jgi:hypothetical protein
VAEFLVHELTHHLLFISERCVAQFYYKEMIKEENFAQSAILNRRRPLDKVVHSIVVSTEILLARQTFLPPKQIHIHPESEVICSQTEIAIDSVLQSKNLDRVVTPWTKRLLSACQSVIRRKEGVECSL